MKMTGAGARRIYFFIFLVFFLIAYPITVFKVGEYWFHIYYGIIVASFLTSLVFLKKDARALLQLGALLFTCLADYCLIMEYGTKLGGMWFFFIVQLFYAARTLLLAKGKKERILNLSIRVIFSALIVFIAYMVLGERLETLFVLAVVYYVNLLISIVFSFLHFKGNELLAIGLLLFACCDIFVGFQELIDVFSIPSDTFFYKLVFPSFKIEAIFYCPSQALLSFSALKRTKKPTFCEKITK